MSVDRLKIIFIQPVIASYRVKYFCSLSEKYDVRFFAGDGKNKGFGSYDGNLKLSPAEVIEILGGKINYQESIFCAMFSSPDLVFINANPRSISMWLALLLGRVLRVPVLLHGQGLYHKPRPTLITKILYRGMIGLCSRYICYTEYSKSTLQFLSLKSISKLRVASNTLVNEYPLLPDEKSFDARGIMFLGRLREGNGLENLLEAVVKINGAGVCSTNLHVVGGGELESHYRERYAKYDFIRFYGPIYDQAKIREISCSCLIGCYPGAAGLSVVHYMSLSLIPLVHRDITVHMGPEPSYVKEGVNGFFFDDFSFESIADSIEGILKRRDSMSIVDNAFQTYVDLGNPGWDEKISNIIDEVVS